MDKNPHPLTDLEARLITVAMSPIHKSQTELEALILLSAATDFVPSRNVEMWTTR